MTKVYKVVKRQNDQFKSALFGNEKFGLTYQIGQITVPLGHSKIFTFSTYEEADRWDYLINIPSTVILECEADLPADQDWVNYYVCPRVFRVSKFLQDSIVGEEPVKLMPPAGTLFANSVTPLRTSL